ncbi:MAG: PaaI family thioesterase [Proteobacteria bacterium]|nr:PaaI family thioesterase [Pseudomonadota bacterium]
MPEPEMNGIIDVETMASMSGLDYLEAMIRRDLPRMPIEKTLGFEIVEAREGRAVFISEPRTAHYNAIGTVHAGYTATLLDSCMACAVLSTLPKGTGFTTMEFKVSLLRPMTKDTGPVRAEGTILSRGRRGASAEGRLTDSRGKLIAHSTTTCLIFSF